VRSGTAICNTFFQSVFGYLSCVTFANGGAITIDVMVAQYPRKEPTDKRCWSPTNDSSTGHIGRDLQDPHRSEWRRWPRRMGWRSCLDDVRSLYSFRPTHNEASIVKRRRSKGILIQTLVRATEREIKTKNNNQKNMGANVTRCSRSGSCWPPQQERELNGTPGRSDVDIPGIPIPKRLFLVSDPSAP
jgi:hypothetical protein